MSTAPLCRCSYCKKCGAIIHFMLDYCGEDYFDSSTNGRCVRAGKLKRKRKKKEVKK